jgi:hypothetical protein
MNLSTDLLNDFTLSNEEMISVRGGDGDPIVMPTQPPIII